MTKRTPIERWLSLPACTHPMMLPGRICSSCGTFLPDTSKEPDHDEEYIREQSPEDEEF